MKVCMYDLWTRAAQEAEVYRRTVKHLKGLINETTNTTDLSEEEKKDLCDMLQAQLKSVVKMISEHDRHMRRFIMEY